jgi:hypothetical protein
MPCPLRPIRWGLTLLTPLGLKDYQATIAWVDQKPVDRIGHLNAQFFIVHVTSSLSFQHCKPTESGIAHE